MFPELKNRHIKLLKNTDVQAVYLFGSRALDMATPLSDYDYAILTRDDSHQKGDELYYALYDIFSDISPRTLENDVIDIVYLKNIGLEMRHHVIRYGKILYDVDSVTRLDFEVKTTLLYCDYRPILDEFDRQILERI
jgi:predicted nucleotidyltransferase